jgi:hypothetical protein
MAKKKRTKTVPYILNDFDLVEHLLSDTDEEFKKSLVEMPFSLLLQNYADYCEAIGSHAGKGKKDAKNNPMDKLYERKHTLSDELKKMMFEAREQSNRSDYYYDKAADELWVIKNKDKKKN